MMKSVRISAAGVLLAALQVAACPPGIAQAYFDTTVQINAAHTGNTNFGGGFAPPLKRTWTVNLGGVVSYTLIANGMVYVTVTNQGGSASQLFALSLATGVTAWSQSINATYGTSFAAYDNGLVFDVNYNGLLHAYSAESGAVLWSTQLNAQNSFSSPPIATNGVVYVGGNSSGGYVFAVNEQTGKVNWTSFLDNGAGAPAYGSGSIYQDTSCVYTSFNYAKGKQLWQSGRPCLGGGYLIPVYYNNRVFDQAASTVGGSVALTANLGQLLWSFASTAPPAIWPGNQSDPLQISSNGSAVIALDATIGQPVWTFTADGALTEPPITINNVIVIGSMSGTLFILNAATGAKLWSTSLGQQIGSLGSAYPEWLGAGEGTLVVPAETTLSAFVQSK